MDADPRYLPDVFPARSELAAPIQRGDRVLGVIDSEGSEPDQYTLRDEVTFISLATIAAAAFPHSTGGDP